MLGVVGWEKDLVVISTFIHVVCCCGIQEMKNELLQHGDYNVILVDWGSGSLALYGQATANTRVVGAMVAQLIKFLQVSSTLLACYVRP